MAEKACSLADLPEYDGSEASLAACRAARLTSPRSLQACAKEGVDPNDLYYKELSLFAEKSLSPRLVQLRYDFFEAKRRDLLASVRRARNGLVSKEQEFATHVPAMKAPKQESTVALRPTASMVAAASALDSDTVRLERNKLARMQANERKWLMSALNKELDNLRKMEKGAEQLAKEAADNDDATRADAERRKADNDRKRELEHQKELERQAQQKLERELAKQEFIRQQQELRAQQEKEALRKKELHLRAKAAAEAKIEAEREKQAAQERAWQRQQERLRDIREKDAERQRVMAEQRAEHDRLVQQKIDARNARIAKAMQNNYDLETKAENDFKAKQEYNRKRQQRLDEERNAFQQEAAAKQLQTMLKRKCIHDESVRKAEERREALLHHQDMVDERLHEHEMKKDRYLDFKRELDSLKEKNKELNVQRMRRRMEHKREMTALQCRQKSEKTDMVQLERQRLWDQRRNMAVASQVARDKIKSTILNQRIKSQYDSNVVANEMVSILGDDLFNPAKTDPSMARRNQGSTSLPNLTAASR